MTRLPAQLPTATTTIACPICRNWQIEYPHEPGIAHVLETVIGDHLNTCPNTPHATPQPVSWIERALGPIADLAVRAMTATSRRNQP